MFCPLSCHYYCSVYFSLKSIGDTFVDKVTYFPLQNESYSFSAEELTLGYRGSKTQFCHPGKMHKVFSRFQKGCRIMCLQNNQWTQMIFAQLECRWHEARKLQFQDNEEDGYCEVTYSEIEHEYNMQEFWYTFHHRDEIVAMSFDDVIARVEADLIRPLVSAGAALSAAWFGNQWEKTSNVQHELCDVTKKALSSFLVNFRESSAHVTVRQKFGLTHQIGINDPFAILLIPYHVLFRCL